MTWDNQKSNFTERPEVGDAEKLPADEWNAHVADQKNHSGRHEDGGSDELDVSGLSGVLADAQTPQTEAVQDIVGALLAANGNISVTYDDAGDVLTIDTSALNTEEVEDAVAALVTAGNAITVNYDDANDALSIGVDESALSFYDGTNLTAPVDNESVSTGDLVGEWDRLITAESDLNSLSADINAGETVAIAQPETPYLLNEWIDIDVDNVTLVAESPFAENGERLIKVADGANIGGIRIGLNTPVSNVTVRRIGIDGNPTNQDSTIKRLHAITAVQGTDITVERCWPTRQNPYHEHNSGGSGITFEEGVTNGTIRYNTVVDPGDRCIQFGSQDTTVYGNFGYDGFDRFIATNYPRVQGSPNADGGAVDFRIINNHARNLAEGSAIGVEHVVRGGRGVVMGNTARGTHRAVVRLRSSLSNVLVAGNVGYKSSPSNNNSGIVIGSNVVGATVAYNQLIGYDGNGIEYRAPGIRSIGNTTRDTTRPGVRFEAADCVSLGDTVKNVTGSNNHGMVTISADTAIGWATVDGVNAIGIYANSAPRTRILAPTIRSHSTKGVYLTGAECAVDQFNVDGGSTGNIGVQVEADGCYVGEGTVRNVEFASISNLSASTGTVVENKQVPKADFVDDGTATTYNGEAVESASAETPQQTYPTGTMVRFTDSGDGSGTGTYLIARDNSTVQISSNT